MRFSSAAFVAFVGAAGCRSGTDANPVDVNGRWAFTEVLEDKVYGYSCADTGSYEITQQGDRFIGRYGQSGVCRTPNGLVDNHDSGTVESGRVLGRTIRFMVTASCQYEGSASGVPTSALAGHGICVLQGSTRTVSLSGAWQAQR